jgi:glycerophosphoryl diester phosphodiesterase
MRIFAHRGASRHEPENTIAAFRRAAAMGADGVELDVRLDADGDLVVHHDDRLPDGRAIAGLARADRPEHLAELAAALLACGDLEVNVEVKSDAPGEGVALAVPVLEVVAAWGGRVIFSSFDPDTVDELHRLAPDLPTAQLTMFPDRSLDELVAWVAERGHVAWHPHHLLVDAASLALAHAAGLAVNTWTVDDPGRLQVLEGLGVDGAVTNDVPGALAALGRAGAPPPVG